MNERIAKLYDQAIVIENGGDYVAGELDPEKFAELIVGECAGICRNVGEAIWTEQHQSNIGTALTCEAAIKEHFGVEE